MYIFKKNVVLLFASLLVFTFVSKAQNPGIAVSIANSGQVQAGNTVAVTATITNTGGGPGTLAANRIRPFVSFPATVSIQSFTLPSGFTLVSNVANTITICQSSTLPVNSPRNLIVIIRGDVVSGPQTISANISFSNGVGCASSGPQTTGNQVPDDNSTTTVEVLPPCPTITASGTVTDVLCNGASTGAVNVTIAGGTAPFTYSWSPGGATTEDLTNVPAGIYTLTATDANNCPVTGTLTYTVNQPANGITASASAGTILCNGATTALTVTASGGTGTLQYSLNGGAYQLSNSFTVNAGTYTVTVKDDNNCTANTNQVIISQPDPITASASAGAIACPGGNTTLTVTASGGTGALQYSLNGGAYQPGNTFTVGGVGPHTVTVKDDNNCTVATAPVTVTVTPDIINPTITAPATVTACTNEGCTATGVELGTPVTADNCSVASVTNNAPCAFPLGSTTVTWTVTDGSGNTATATQTVIISDNVSPTIYLNQSSLVPGVTGPSSSQSPYLLPSQNGVKFTSVLTVPDVVGGYQMVGLPDGLGAYDNCDGTFSLLMNHELGSGQGAARAHGAIGSFVSKWTINKSTLQVVSGIDLMQQVYNWNSGTQTSNTTTSTIVFNRFCSADLPGVSAFYNCTSGLGTKARIFMHGEEGGANGYQVGTVATGPDAGKAYILGKFNLSTNGSGLTGVGGWENALANPFEQNKTIVIGMNDGGSGIMNNSIAVYVGTKTNTGSEVDKAGLTNGTLSFVNVAGSTTEIVNSTTRATNITSGTAFTLSGTSSTVFSRPEDAVWNPADPKQLFFVTTDQRDDVPSGLSPQIGRSRLWRLNFTDITDPSLGGTIDLLLDGTEGHNMLDNMTADKHGHLLLQEDVGGTPLNSKIWQYTIATDQLTLLAKHDPARFGDRVAGVTTLPTAPYTHDEESSGIIDMSDILGAGMFILTDQAHYPQPSPSVEGGQLLVMFNPASMGASATAQSVLNVCSGTGVNLGTPAVADNCSIASLTNDAPATFPLGATTVTWTVVDGSGNSATATQTVNNNAASAPVVGTITQPTCLAGTGSVDLSGLPSGNWTLTRNPGAVTSTGNTATTTVSGLAPGTYTFTVTNAAPCTSPASVNVVINPAPGAPAPPTASVIQPTCTVATGTITITSPTAGLTFSLDGGAYAPYPVGGYTGQTPGAHTLTANAGGCISTVTNVTVNAQPASPAAPTTSVVQPTCTVATGKITITSPTAGLMFSLDGGAYASYPVAGYTVAAGSHTLTARDNGTLCISSITTVTVDPQPATPSAPTVGAITQPTCAVPSGSVVLNGLPSGNWTLTRNPGAVTTTGNTASTTVTGLNPGTTYTFTATNDATCTSASSANVVISAIPGAPAAPTVSVVQPTCTVATGTITVTSTTAGLTFSLDGGAFAPYPVGGYTGVLPGAHNLRAQSGAGCISVATNITVNAQPATPAAPTTSVVHPTCTVATGTITVTSPTAGLTFSLNGGAFAAYPAAGYSVAAGAHTLRARNTSLCISATTNVTVNAQPATPAAPTIGAITQPTCASPTGSVVLSGLPSGNWTVTGTPGGATTSGNTPTTTVTGLNPGTLYSFTVTNAAGCTSIASAKATINAIPGAPAAPTATVVQPTCTVATGTITITSATVGLTFSLDGGAFAAYPAGGYPGQASGPHSLRARNAAGCTSGTTTVTVNAQPATPSAPTATVTQPTCTVATGTITITSATAGLTFSLDAAAFAAYPAAGYTGVAAGAHTLRARNASGCISGSTIVSVNPQPSSPVASSTATPCVMGSADITVTATGGTPPYVGTGTFTRTAGTYTFTVTDANGCSSTTTITVCQTCSNYVVYAKKDVDFGYNNDINGDVGVTDANGEAEFGRGDILDPYTVTAKNIMVQMPATVNNRVFAPATGGPSPAFLPYTGSGLSGNYNQTTNGTVPSGNFMNLTIKRNVIATINGSNYGKVVIEEGARATFTNSNINLTELEVKRGRSTSLTTVSFSGTTPNVRVKTKVLVEEQSRVNVGGPKVTFHIAKGRGDEFKVKGDNTQVTLDINVPDGTLKVEGKNTIMTGLFIVEELKGVASNVIWNNGCQVAPLMAKGGMPVIVEVEKTFNVSVSPNPSASDFRLLVTTASDEPISVRVFDISGKTLKVISNANHNSPIVVGAELLQGSYYAEVQQGANRKTVKLIKLN